MKNKILYIVISSVLLTFFGCEDILESGIDTNLKPEQVYVNYSRMKEMAGGAYTGMSVASGFYKLNGTLRACTTDEAEETLVSSPAQIFNLGLFNQYSNPENIYESSYVNIRRCCQFLENSEDFRNILAVDTISSSGKTAFDVQTKDINWYRNEVRFLRSFYYFELIKRYGDVPLVSKTLDQQDDLFIERTDFDIVVDYIIDECDAVKDKLPVDWIAIGKPENHGRITKGTVLALKSRVLLYAASKLNNPQNDKEKWEKAALAANELISMNKYKLYNNYQNLFLAPQSYNCNEVIFFFRAYNSNSLERANYPIGTPGANSGVSPTQNLVDGYEHLEGWNSNNPYQNVDPRLNMSIVVNGSNWNGRTIESWVGGGIDAMDQKNASRTGYYLKKFLSPNLNLLGSPAGTSMKSWIVFRYAEILLNYAEAMNEAYGPDALPGGYVKSAREALNEVRQRTSVNLPDVNAANIDEMRDAIKRERRVELAFEDHRAWDLRRWKEAEILGDPIYGMRISKDENDTFSYEKVKVEDRYFDEKMYLYPIPQNEINKYPEGTMSQNPNW